MSNSGFTLIEALLASVVLAMVVGAVVMPFTAGAANTVQNARSTLAINLAQDLMEEILAKPFHDPDGSDAGETGRSNWDDMDDYDGYSEAEGSIAGFDGVATGDPASTALTRNVTVASVYIAGQDQSEEPTFLRVTVNIRYHGDALVSLSRLVYANAVSEGGGDDD
ncbi:MAG: prepilin-type N-terminal cleavage/methylation domain-containing protein [Phycisphaerae bacterium]|nr:prepilin-type N-terminal cleavage/methylation domain-containing protein [Phycisphaerae bacterium]